jgi:pimeloyl-ACP methyl ester carboxylesterase
MRWDLQKIALRARGQRDAYEAAHSHFWCDTSDGVRLAGTRLGSNDETAIVLAHGFMAYRTKPKWRVLAEGLAQQFTVYTFDMRGHGQSAGACTGGERELLDVHAVIDYARERGHQRVVTVGGSLGGIAVVLEAAHFRDPDAVVAISTPAVWSHPESTKMVRRMTWLFMSPIGRALARRLMGTTIDLAWGNPEPPADVIARISPIPILIVHGENDHFFPPDDARMLFERAGDPKRLLLIPEFGHSEDGFTPEFADRLAGEVQQLLAAAPSR